MNMNDIHRRFLQRLHHMMAGTRMNGQISWNFRGDTSDRETIDELGTTAHSTRGCRQDLHLMTCGGLMHGQSAHLRLNATCSR